MCATQLLEGAKTEVENQERKERKERNKRREDSNVGKVWSGKKKYIYIYKPVVENKK